MHAQDGQTAAAVAAFRYAIEQARTLDDAIGVRDLLNQLGMAYRRADTYDAATECLHESLAASRELDDAHAMADTLYHLGTVAWSNGRNVDALACHGEAVALCEQHGFADLVAVQAWHGNRAAQTEPA